MATYTTLTAIPGVGAAIAARLTEHRITTAEQLAATSLEDLFQVTGFNVPGIGHARAKKVHAAAVELVGVQPESSAAEPDKEEKAKKEKKGKEKKAKKEKKGKKEKKAKKKKKGKGKKDKKGKGKKDKKGKGKKDKKGKGKKDKKKGKKKKKK